MKPQRWFWILFGFAALLRLVEVGTPNYWYDEAFTVWASRLPIPQMIQATAADTHPPLYLLITWAVVHTFGSAEWVVRLPSVLASLIGLYLAYRIARKLQLSPLVQIVAVAAVALMPAQLHYAQEARMYSLLQMEVLGIWLAVLERRWFWVFFCSLAALYTHNYALFYLPPLGIMALLAEVKRPYLMDLDTSPEHLAQVPYYIKDNPYQTVGDLANLQGPILAMGAALLLWLPWLVYGLLGQMGTVAEGYWIQPVTPGAIIYALYMLFTAFAIPESLQPLVVVIITGALAYSLWQTARQPGQHASLAWLSLAPLGLAVLASLIWKPVLLFRGLIGSSVPLYFWLARALLESKPAYKQLYAAVLLVPLLSAGLVGQYLYNPEHKGSTLQLVNQVRAAWQPGDVIYHINDGSMVPWSVYAPDLPQVELVTCDKEDPGALSDRSREALEIHQDNLDNLTGRAWIIWGDGPTSTACEHNKAKQLTSQANLVQLVQDNEYVRMGIYLYDH